LIRRIDCPFVFADQDGRRYLDVRRSFLSACRRAGIKDFRFHDLRHTFASQLVMAGVDLTTVSTLLGHKSLTMTLRYAHLSPQHTTAAVGVLDEGSGYDLVTLQKGRPVLAH
jgi:integrase